MIRSMTILIAAAVAAAVITQAGCLSPADGGDLPPMPPAPPAPPEVAAGGTPQPDIRNSAVTESGPAKTVVIIETTMGTMQAELWPDKAPSPSRTS